MEPIKKRTVYAYGSDEILAKSIRKEDGEDLAIAIGWSRGDCWYVIPKGSVLDNLASFKEAVEVLTRRVVVRQACGSDNRVYFFGKEGFVLESLEEEDVSLSRPRYPLKLKWLVNDLLSKAPGLAREGIHLTYRQKAERCKWDGPTYGFVNIFQVEVDAVPSFSMHRLVQGGNKLVQYESVRVVKKSTGEQLLSKLFETVVDEVLKHHTTVPASYSFNEWRRLQRKFHSLSNKEFRAIHMVRNKNGPCLRKKEYLAAVEQERKRQDESVRVAIQQHELTKAEAERRDEADYQRRLQEFKLKYAEYLSYGDGESS